jgi:hypothetical protein
VGNEKEAHMILSFLYISFNFKMSAWHQFKGMAYTIPKCGIEFSSSDGGSERKSKQHHVTGTDASSSALEFPGSPNARPVLPAEIHVQVVP